LRECEIRNRSRQQPAGKTSLKEVLHFLNPWRFCGLLRSGPSPAFRAITYRVLVLNARQITAPSLRSASRRSETESFRGEIPSRSDIAAAIADGLPVGKTLGGDARGGHRLVLGRKTAPGHQKALARDRHEALV